MAVDGATDALLHRASAPQVGSASAPALVLARKSTGEQPRVLVPDLNQEYAAVIRAVVPQAEPHAWVFHALHAGHRQSRAVAGTDDRAPETEAVAVQEQLDQLLRATTRRRAWRR